MEKRINRILKKEKKIKEVMELLAPHVHPSRLSAVAEELIAHFEAEKDLPHNRNKDKMKWSDLTTIIKAKVLENA